MASVKVLAKQPLEAPPIGAEITSTVVVGVAAFAFVQLALAAFMAISPHGFYTAIGPFGAYNGHYIRDVSTFYGAIGIGLSVAIRRPSWRVPMLALASAQYALHCINHLFDIARANPASTGYFDFFSLLGATALLAWLWRAAALEART